MSDPTWSERTLANGLRVVVEPDHVTPAVAVCLWYAVGSRDEVAGKTGFAHLFEHLMFQGSGHVATGEHMALIQGAGGQLNATTSMDRTNYFETVPRTHLETALWLEADRMGHLIDALDQANLDNQRDVVRNERRQRYDNVPYGDVLETMFGALFPAGHPYAHLTIGSMADLADADLTDVASFWRRHYGPDNAVLAVVGDIDADEAYEAVERYFGPLPPIHPAARPDVRELTPLEGITRLELTGAVPAERHISAWRVPPKGTPEAAALDLAMIILGGGRSGRLVSSLVRGQQIAAGVGASLMGLAAGNDAAMLTATARAGVGADELEAAVLDELGNLATAGPTDAELARARAQVERAHLGRTSTLGGRADLWCEQGTLFGDPGRATRLLAFNTSPTGDDIRAAVATYLDPDHRLALAYRPATAVAA